MIGADTTFLVQLELVELPAHSAARQLLQREILHPTEDSTRLAFDWLQRQQLGRKRILDTQLAATLWTAGIQRLITSNPTDFQLLGFETIAV